MLCRSRNPERTLRDLLRIGDGNEGEKEKSEDRFHARNFSAEKQSVNSVAVSRVAGICHKSATTHPKNHCVREKQRVRIPLALLLFVRCWVLLSVSGGALLLLADSKNQQEPFSPRDFDTTRTNTAFHTMRGKSAFALFAISLRAARGLTQEEFADDRLDTLKNLERGHGVSVAALAALYRDNPRLRGKYKVTDEEWLRLVVHWVSERTGDGGRGMISTAEFGAANETVKQDVTEHIRPVLELAEKLSVDEAALIEAVIKAVLADRKRELVFRALEGLLLLVPKETAPTPSPLRSRNRREKHPQT